MIQEAELRKGCGKRFRINDPDKAEHNDMCHCHTYYLCPTCQAKLEIFTETNSKWKQAIQKTLQELKEDKRLRLDGFEKVVIDRIFGELTNKSQQSSSPVANTDEAQVVGAVGSNPTADTQSPNKSEKDTAIPTEIFQRVQDKLNLMEEKW